MSGPPRSPTRFMPSEREATRRCLGDIRHHIVMAFSIFLTADRAFARSDDHAEAPKDLVRKQSFFDKLQRIGMTQKAAEPFVCPNSGKPGGRKTLLIELLVLPDPPLSQSAKFAACCEFQKLCGRCGRDEDTAQTRPFQGSIYRLPYHTNNGVPSLLNRQDRQRAQHPAIALRLVL